MPKKAVELEETSKFGHFCTSIVRDTSLLFFSNSFGYYTSYYDLDTFSHSSKSLSLSPSHSLSRKYKSIFLCMKMYRVTYFYPLKQITIIFLQCKKPNQSSYILLFIYFLEYTGRSLLSSTTNRSQKEDFPLENFLSIHPSDIKNLAKKKKQLSLLLIFFHVSDKTENKNKEFCFRRNQFKIPTECCVTTLPSI